MVKHAGGFLVAAMVAMACEHGRALPGDDLDDQSGEACFEASDMHDCGHGFVQFCERDEDDALVFAECIEEDKLVCQPGDSLGCEGSGWKECIVQDGVPAWGECIPEATPLVLVMPGTTLAFEPSGTATFDLEGGCLSQDWPSAATPWLALDIDGNGSIDDGRELFGSGTFLRSGRRATDGFAALAELDADRDGRITPADPAFASLVLWADHDGDRRSNHSEHSSLASAGVLSIPVDFARDAHCDGRGNCGLERAEVAMTAASAEIVDVHLACQ